jgi:hypothetical protein
MRCELNEDPSEAWNVSLCRLSFVMVAGQGSFPNAVAKLKCAVVKGDVEVSLLSDYLPRYEC